MITGIRHNMYLLCGLIVSVASLFSLEEICSVAIVAIILSITHKQNALNLTQVNTMKTNVERPSRISIVNVSIARCEGKLECRVKLRS